jgi:hypothetical protein
MTSHHFLHYSGSSDRAVGFYWSCDKREETRQRLVACSLCVPAVKGSSATSLDRLNFTSGVMRGGGGDTGGRIYNKIEKV